jgi:5-methylcytosine-specific restriction endonuclease McrA
VLHVDHVVPLAAGGVTREDNLRTACEECNLGKAARAVVTEGAATPERRDS